MTEPYIDRPLVLHMQADWGGANLTRVCGWLGMELTARTAPGTRVAIWNGRGFVDNVRALGRGEVDLAIATPAPFIRMALDGRGPYEGEAFPGLRAVGVVPQRDRLVFAVRNSFGVTTFEELRAAKPQLTVTTSGHDGVSHVGMAMHELLTRSGVDIEGWGGKLLGHELPTDCLADVLDGRADAIVHEAVMLPGWQEIGEDLAFLPVEPEVLAGLEEDFGWPAADVPDDYFPGTPGFRTLDFSDFLVMVREEMPEDVAHALAWILGETREMLEQQYRHLLPERSPVTYPLDPVTMGRAPIPLHPGAAAYYDSLGG
ncbi:TAXI family TRAP transporter solute-binding subunit [Amycolatopsis sp. NPDC049688]|uniref:TAXI family TRAP transporter solute-binding subunit n=1 Tax=Amycolatopsis sp. NPDC049688 TaxID=3154733 RepID=UPI00342873EC